MARRCVGALRQDPNAKFSFFVNLLLGIRSVGIPEQSARSARSPVGACGRGGGVVPLNTCRSSLNLSQP